METEHKEGVVDRAVAYVKDLLGMPGADEKPVESQPYTPTDDPEGVFTTHEAMEKYPEEQIPESAFDLNAKSARKEDGEQRPQAPPAPAFSASAHFSGPIVGLVAPGVDW